jgi:antitoxin component of MazEF toxin-antitoxin module
MGYTVKIQKVNRPTNTSYYLSFPSALAQLLNVTKGEEFEWVVEDKNLILLKRVNTKKNLKLKNK